MARCGCVSGPCDCQWGASDCIGVAGAGTVEDPIVPFAVLSEDARNLVECRDDGLFAPEWVDIQSVASVAALTLPDTGAVFNITGTTTITSIVATGNSGRVVTLKFVGVLTVTDGSNLALAGNFATTANDTMQLACDGTTWFEVGRSAN